MTRKKQYKLESYAKANTLIEGKGKNTLLAIKLGAIGNYKLQVNEYELSENKGNFVVNITVAEIRDRLGIKGNSIYENLRDVAKRMMTSFIMGFIDDESRRFSYQNLITGASYENGVFSIVFNGDMKKYLFPPDYKLPYTILELNLISHWKQTYTSRIYEVIKSNCYGNSNGIYEIDFNLAEFKFMIGCYNVNEPEVKKILEGSRNPNYELAETKIKPTVNSEGKIINNLNLQWTNFNRYTLQPAIKEINETQESLFKISEIKTLTYGRGAKVKKIIFVIHRKDIITTQNDLEIIDLKEEETLTETEKFKIHTEVFSLLAKYELEIKDIIAICEAANYDIKKITYANELLSESNTNISNVTGWLISCIKKDYKIKKINSNIGFNGFSQRKYDFDKLEDMLLEANDDN